MNASKSSISKLCEFAERASYIRKHQIELFFSLRTEPADSQVSAEQHDRKIRRGLKIDQVTIHLITSTFRLAIFIDRGQFLVGGLELFFGRFQLFVAALQFLVSGRLNFFVGSLEFLTSWAASCSRKTGSMAGLREFALQVGDAAIALAFRALSRG